MENSENIKYRLLRMLLNHKKNNEDVAAMQVGGITISLYLSLLIEKHWHFNFFEKINKKNFIIYY